MRPASGPRLPTWAPAEPAAMTRRTDADRTSAVRRMDMDFPPDFGADFPRFGVRRHAALVRHDGFGASSRHGFAVHTVFLLGNRPPGPGRAGGGRADFPDRHLRHRSVHPG